LSYTDPDPTKKPVPGWHGSLSQRVSLRFLYSRGAGTNGLRPSFRWNPNSPVSPTGKKGCKSGENLRLGEQLFDSLSITKEIGMGREI